MTREAIPISMNSIKSLITMFYTKYFMEKIKKLYDVTKTEIRHFICFWSVSGQNLMDSKFKIFTLGHIWDEIPYQKYHACI
jgi:hypothetical protein